MQIPHIYILRNKICKDLEFRTVLNKTSSTLNLSKASAMSNKISTVLIPQWKKYSRNTIPLFLIHHFSHFVHCYRSRKNRLHFYYHQRDSFSTMVWKGTWPKQTEKEIWFLVFSTIRADWIAVCPCFVPTNPNFSPYFFQFEFGCFCSGGRLIVLWGNFFWQPAGRMSGVCWDLGIIRKNFNGGIYNLS